MIAAYYAPVRDNCSPARYRPPPILFVTFSSFALPFGIFAAANVTDGAWEPRDRNAAERKKGLTRYIYVYSSAIPILAPVSLNLTNAQ